MCGCQTERADSDGPASSRKSCEQPGSLPDSSGLLVGSPINEGRLFSMSGARYWERIDEAAPRPTYVSMALPTFPYKDLWGGSQIEKTRFAY